MSTVSQQRGSTWANENGIDSNVDSDTTPFFNQADQGLASLEKESFPDLNLFREELRTLTDMNRVVKEVERDRHMFEAMERLFDKIVHPDTFQTMRQSALDGYDQSIIYRFPHQGEWEEYPIMFLLKGPMVDRGSGAGETYFKGKGDMSLLERIRLALHPFKIKHRFNRLRQENMIIAYW